MAPHDSCETWTPVKLLCMQHKPTAIPDTIVADILVQNHDRLSKAERIDLFASLLVKNRLPVLRRWFDYTNIAEQLYDAESSLLYLDIVRSIRGNGIEMEIAEFLFESCESFWDENNLLDFIICCSAHAGAFRMLRKILELPQCPNVAADWDNCGSNARSPMMTALLNHCPANFQLLLDSVSDRTAIKRKYASNRQNGQI